MGSNGAKPFRCQDLLEYKTHQDKRVGRPFPNTKLVSGEF